MPEVDAAFLAMPLRGLAAVALERAGELGAQHADFRLERIRTGVLRLRDARPDTTVDDEQVGLCVRVVHDGAWGFAAGITRTGAGAAALAEQAVATARASRSLTHRDVELAPEPVYSDVTWVSAYDVDPFDIPLAERSARMAELSERLLAADGVDHVDAALTHVLENTFYADTAGSMITQQRVRIEPEFTAVRVDRAAGTFDTMRTLAPPTAQGWEYLDNGDAHGWDFDAEIAELPGLLAEHAKAPSVAAGRYDLVIDPTNLWLTIHESVGHATELDRALGFEAAYAGTSFATPDQLHTLRYGSDLMNVTGDRTTAHGLATVGWDAEGVAAQQFDIVRDGVLVGYQLNRDMAYANAGLLDTTPASSRSNGCAYADSPAHIPMQRMPNVSLAARPDGPDLATLIADVERGIYVVGDRSWSIDSQRFNFQFTGQRFFRIENGTLSGQLRDVAYQATTTDFWGSMSAIGGPQTYRLGGALNCGKGQPGQSAPVSHGCPAAVFRGVNVLNTRSEGTR